MLRLLLHLTVFLSYSLCLLAQTIPATRLVNWQSAGLDVPFILPENTINVLDFGAVGNNSNNDAPAIQAAINSLGANGGIVYIPSGTYLMQSGLSLPSGVSLRGASATTTHLRFDLANSGSTCINVSGAVAGNYRAVTSGYELGSSLLSVADTAGFAAGHFAELVQDNNSTWDTQPASWANDSKGQMVRIAAVSNNQIALIYPLRTTFDATHNVRIRPINPAKNIAIECLHIERVSDATGSGGGNNIAFTYSVNCRISGVHSDKSVGAHFFVFQCSDMEIKGCYVHHAFTYDGSSTRGYGVVVGAHTGQCLIVNNIFKHLRHAMSIKQGANGNVFAYNYAFDGYRSEFPNDFASDISLHGHYAYANLLEGNHCELFWIDDAWGPSGPYNTVFRNRFARHGIYMTSNGSHSQNLVGNEVTSNAFLQGFYVLTGNDHFTYGNNIKGTINPAGTTTLPDISYFFDNTPDFWNISATFPPIGIPNSIGSQTIPAKERYNAGNYTICAATAPAPRLKIRALLQGVYNNGGTMAANLRTQHLLPIAQPFNIAPFDYKGSEVLYDFDSIPSNAIDWVLIELRQATNPMQMVASRAALLLNDGNIADLDGNLGIAFEQVASGNYYVAIYTRNHLPLLSAMPVPLPNAMAFDFGMPDNVCGNANQLVLHSDNNYLIPAGDCLLSGYVNYGDINAFQTYLSTTTPNYYTSDCNMDGWVNSTDYNLLLPNIGKIGCVELRH
jgi:hypothetical protein